MDLAALLTGKTDPGYSYGNILPYKFADPSGSGQRAPGTPVSPAVPGLVHQAIGSLVNALTTPRDVMRGMSHQDMEKRSLDMALSLAGLGSGAVAPEGSLGMFAGRRAKTANLLKLDKAQMMEDLHKQKGIAPEVSRGSIYAATGWLRGADGEWRFEIPDHDAEIMSHNLQRGKVSPDNVGVPHGIPESAGNRYLDDVRLPDVLYHPELYKAYPDLENTVVQPMSLAGVLGGVTGSYNPIEGYMRLAAQKPVDFMSTVLHETQHNVQTLEGFQNGGNSQMFLPADFDKEYDTARGIVGAYHKDMTDKGINPYFVQHAVELMKKGRPIVDSVLPHYADFVNLGEQHNSEYLGALDKLEKLHKQKQGAYLNYTGLAGEVEARLTQQRYHDLAAVRAGITPPNELNAPWSSAAWVPYEDQIVPITNGTQKGTPSK